MLQASEWQVLDYLTLISDEPVFVSKIARDTGLGKGTVSKALSVLRDFNFINYEHKGRMSFYKIDHKFAAVERLRVAFNLVDIEPKLKQLKKYTYKIILFGSCAEGTDTFQSDIDILLIARDKKKVSDLTNKIKSARKIQWVIKTAEEYMKLEKDEPVFKEEINKGLVLWEAYDNA